MQFVTRSVKETGQVAAAIAAKLRPGDLLAFTGGMGAGKTTFTGALVEALGIEAHVSSPTFALIQEYRGEGGVVYHFDMYRIHGYDDLMSTGFYDFLESDGILVVEWSENIRELLPPGAIWVHMEPMDETTRKITVEGDARFENTCH